MNLIRLSIDRPMAIVAMVLMIVLFGYVALQRIPIQMAPDVRQPVIIVTTNWRGAAPAEVEREIIIPQEDELKRLEGVQRVLSEASHGRGKITLEFSPGVSFDRMLLLVSNRLDRVTGYPEEAEEPVLGTSGTEDNAIAWFVFTRVEGNDRSMITYGDFLRDIVQERLERVPGIGGVNIFGETEREMQVVIDPLRLARYRLTVGDVINRLRAANASVTGGDIDEGKRRYVVRTEGDFAVTSQVEAVVLRSNAQGAGLGRVTVGDIATVTLDYKEPRARLFSNGVPALGLNLTREQGANVIETMKLVQATMDRLRTGPIQEVGLRVQQVYDETDYINSSIDLVLQNIYFGGALAIVILIVFLRSWRPTVVVAFAIPVSVVGSFVAMALLGRSLNVISLAGIAFAVGMVVDAAIVVLENIYRLRQGGMGRSEAAYHGTAQVWPAVLVSALTTVMVFIPILIMDLEVGQLFRDIAVAISVSVLLSLLVSVTLIPALSNRMLAGRVATKSSMLRLPLIDHFARGFGNFWRYFARLVVRSKLLALLVVGAITAAASVFAIAYLPKLDYLPVGNRNFVIGFVLPPAGYNLDTTENIARGVAEQTRKHWSDAALAESGGAHPPGTDEAQKVIDQFFFVALQGRAFIAARHVDEQKAPELIPILQSPARQEPGTLGFVFQPSLFGRSIGSGRSIDIDISGPELETIFATGRQVFFRTMSALSPRDGHRTRPKPALTLGEPEVRVLPDRVKLADNGLSARDLGQAVDAFNDGIRVAEINVDGKRIDLTLKGPAQEHESTQSIAALPVVTKDGLILPVRSLSDVKVTSGPTQIRRTDRVRTVTMSVSPRPRDAASGGDGEDPVRGDRAASEKRPARRRAYPYVGLGRQIDRHLERDRARSRACRRHRLSGDGGSVRELRLPPDRPVVGAHRRGRGARRSVGAQHLCNPAARHADHARLCHIGRHCRQQRHPAGPPDPLPHPSRGHDGGRCDRGGDREPHPADLHVDPDLGLRNAAAGGGPRRGLRALSRARIGRAGRAVAIGGPHHGGGPADDVDHGRGPRTPGGKEGPGAAGRHRAGRVSRLAPLPGDRYSVRRHRH